MGTASPVIDGQEAIDPIPEGDAGRSPRRDTLGCVLAAPDAELFTACFTAWVEGLRETEPDIVAIDGKSSRRSHDRSRGREPLHLVSAWATRQRLVLGQEAASAKSNEITAIPLLLERLALEGALVTIDAIGTQKRHRRDHLGPRRRVPAGAQGQPARHLQGCRGLLCRPAARHCRDPHHRRRRAWPHRDPPSRRLPRCGLAVLGPALPRRACLPRPCHDRPSSASWRRLLRTWSLRLLLRLVESKTERDGKTSREQRYYLGSARLDARTFAHAVRGHWGIENRLHWLLDVVLRDDLARLRTGHGPANMAVVRHMAINLLRQARPTSSLENRRQRAGWNNAYLESLIRQTA